MEKESGRDMLGNELLKFFTIQNLRAESGEISTETIKNYLKPIKLFCEMNRITINWKIISKRIKKGNRYSSDRAPSPDEIRALLSYTDRRVKPIVLIMISCGMRVSSWAYLKWGHIIPKIGKDVVIAAKIKIFNTKTNRYYDSYITRESYQAIKEYMDFRESFGEKII